jgi:hypothetical protein
LQLRGKLGGAQSKVPRRFALPEALGFHIEPAQTKQPCLRVVRHVFKHRPCIVIAPLQDRRLRVQQLDQRLLIRTEELRRLPRHPPRHVGVASACGDHARRDRLIGPVAFAGAEMALDQDRRADNALDQPPNQHHQSDKRHKRHRCREQRHFVAHALPSHDEISRTVGQPGKAGGEREDQKHKAQYADHLAAPAALRADVSALVTSASVSRRALSLPI